MNQTKPRSFLGEYQYPTSARVAEIVGILAYVIFAALTALKTIELIGSNLTEMSPWQWAAVVAAPWVAYLMGDFASGLVHCAADNFGEETTYFFGPAFIRPFRDHHRDPQGITHHDFIEVNGNSCLVNLLVLIPSFLVLRTSENEWCILLGIFILSFTLSIVLTNQIHKWAHQTVPPIFIQRLQKRFLILNPEDHRIHHTPPFDRYYCITSGWLNPVLEKLGFFVWLVRTFDWARPAKPDSV